MDTTADSERTNFPFYKVQPTGPQLNKRDREASSRRDNVNKQIANRNKKEEGVGQCQKRGGHLSALDGLSEHAGVGAIRCAHPTRGWLAHYEFHCHSPLGSMQTESVVLAEKDSQRMMLIVRSGSQRETHRMSNPLLSRLSSLEP